MKEIALAIFVAGVLYHQAIRIHDGEKPSDLLNVAIFIATLMLFLS